MKLHWSLEDRAKNGQNKTETFHISKYHSSILGQNKICTLEPRDLESRGVKAVTNSYLAFSIQTISRSFCVMYSVFYLSQSVGFFVQIKTIFCDYVLVKKGVYSDLSWTKKTQMTKGILFTEHV